MNKIAALVLLFAALTGPVCVAQAQDTQAYKVLLTQHENFAKAGSRQAYAAFLHPDFTMTAPDGTIVTRAQTLADYSSATVRTGLPKVQPAPKKVDSLSLQGDKGVLQESSVAIYKQKDTAGTLGPKGQEHEWRITQTNKYTWTRSAKEWLLLSIANVGVEVLVDGKPSPASKTP